MLAPQARILRYEEIVRAAELINCLRPLRKIRITGGEPLVRRNLPSFIGLLRRHFPGVELTMTTNGTALAGAAAALKRAGLSRINVSLDAIDPELFRRSTGSSDLATVIQGIDAALEAGLRPLKLNSVLQRSINLGQIPDLLAFAAGRQCELRFIELMRIGPARQLDDDEYVSMAEAKTVIQQRWSGITPLEHGENSRRFLVQTDHGPARVGFITPVSHPFCSTCDRLRLDARGRLHACLRHGDRIELLDMIRSGADDQWSLRQIRVLLEGKAAPGSRWGANTRMFSMGG
jgi:cyclic pyranopterin phosphate synthase